MKKETIRNIINESVRSGDIIREMDNIIKTRSLIGKEDLLNQLISLRDKLALLLDEFAKIKNLPLVDSDAGKATTWEGNPYQGAYQEADLLMFCKYLPEKAKLDNEIKLLTQLDRTTQTKENVNNKKEKSFISKFDKEQLIIIFKKLIDAKILNNKLEDVDTWLYLFGEASHSSNKLNWNTGAEGGYVISKCSTTDRPPWKLAEQNSNKKCLSNFSCKITDDAKQVIDKII